MNLPVQEILSFVSLESEHGECYEGGGPLRAFVIKDQNEPGVTMEKFFPLRLRMPPKGGWLDSAPYG